MKKTAVEFKLNCTLPYLFLCIKNYEIKNYESYIVFNILHKYESGLSLKANFCWKILLAKKSLIL